MIKKILTLILVLGLLMAGAVYAEEDELAGLTNIIKNPGFEEYAEDRKTPTYWDDELLEINRAGAAADAKGSYLQLSVPFELNQLTKKIKLFLWNGTEISPYTQNIIIGETKHD